MPSISKKLESLGVSVGTEGLINNSSEPHEERELSILEGALSARILSTKVGNTLAIETIYPSSYHHGKSVLSKSIPLEGLAIWAGENRVSEFSAPDFAFIDTETTGLSGGTGTYAFLIGIGRFIEDEFHLTQLFMQDPVNEAAQLAALEELLAPIDSIVTFNGKAFDIPLLHSRFVINRWPAPFSEKIHIDLLHLARRLWKYRLPSRTLGNLEIKILGTSRTDEDIPGWAIPQMYFNYLSTGDAIPIKRVIYHNAMDIVSLAALFNHMAEMLSNPSSNNIEHGVDLVALGRLFEDLGDVNVATRLYLYGLEHQDVLKNRMPESIYLDALFRLAIIYKRKSNYKGAILLWETGTTHQHIPSFVELAKFYEHKSRDFKTAKHWTELAIKALKKPQNRGVVNSIQRYHMMPELEHRLSRLLRKLSK